MEVQPAESRPESHAVRRGRAANLQIENEEPAGEAEQVDKGN